MKFSVCFILFCVIIWVNADDQCAEQTGSVDTVAVVVSSTGIQLLLAKLDQLQHKFLELQYELHEHREEIAHNQATQEKTFSEFLGVIHHLDGRVNQLEKNVGRNLTVLQDRSWQILTQQTACANHDALQEKLFDFIPKQNQSIINLERLLFSNNSSLKLGKQDCVTAAPEDTSTPVTSTTVPDEVISIPATTSAAAPEISSTPVVTATPPVTTTTPPITSSTPPVTSTTPKVEPPSASCKDVASTVSGTYLIRAKNESEPFSAYCEQEQFGGGWLVFQYRYDGSVDFYRNWNEFKYGFGDIKGEFWLGLEKLHQLTSARPNELIVELKDFSDTYKFAQYDAFEIGSETELYSLKTLGKYSGTAGDSLDYQKGMKFTTKDRDNDERLNNCAKNYEGAWWHKSCHQSHLNGRYLNMESNNAMSWITFHKKRQGLSYSRMMIRPID